METLTKQDDNLTNTHSFFTSKEHYLAFLSAWRKFIADGGHKCETYTDGQGGTCKMDSKLTCIHHLIYNGLRKRDLHKSFAPKQDSDDPYEAYYDARSALASATKFGYTESLKLPFGGTVTDDMLKEVSDTLQSVSL